MTVAVVGLCAAISLAEGSVCVASAFTIATGKHILVTATLCLRSQLRAHQRWKLAMQGARQASESGWGYSECTVCDVCLCCLFIRNDPETTETQGHSNTIQLQHPPSLPRSRSTNTHNERRRAHAIDQKFRRGANEENVHQKEMLEDPLIIVRGEELVAPDPTACEHYLAAWSGPAPADRNRTAGAAVAPSSSSACSIWTPWMLTGPSLPQASRCRT